MKIFVQFTRCILNFSIPLFLFQYCNTFNETKATAVKEPSGKRILPGAVNAITQFAEVNGKKLAYRSIGEGEPIILCTRFRGNLDTWDPAFLDALAKNFRVITFDYSGFALSQGTPPETALGFAEDVRDLARSLQLGKVIVGGWSLGGWIAAIVTTEFPEIVSKTIIIGSKPPGKNKYGIEQIFLETAYKASYTVTDETILFFEPASKASRDAAQKSHDRIAARSKDLDIPVKESLWEYYRKCGEDFEKDPYNARDKLTTTQIPILVISADHEICFPPENWFTLNRKLPTTQIIVIPQSGHGVQHQYPELIGQYITNFLKSDLH
jgi:pimeloyl-ACP methyl ester carboxylesterase